jgi:two-component system nitrogen regulation response regulator GlnG
MNDSDHTLTSPLPASTPGGGALLGVTIAWHPETRRVGEQFVGLAEAGTMELSRYLPAFRRPEGDGEGLGHGSVSRTAVRLVRDAVGGITVWPPQSRMTIELNGKEIHEPSHLTREQIARGAILGLGRTVLLCLHWMHCLPRNNPVPGFVGVGGAAIATREQIRQVAKTNAAVLLLGETGTGKEVAARAIHALSKNAGAAMVCVNMATLSDTLAAADLFGAVRGAYTGAQTARQGLFAQAQDSTLFLDEIGNTPGSVQPMLLRVLESGEYRPLGATRDEHANARLIAATDQDLYGAGFNQALLRRLEHFVIRIPPLRCRREDIGLLLAQMLHAVPAADRPAVPAALVGPLLNHDWPGNVRDLANVFRRVLLALEARQEPDVAAMLDLRSGPPPVEGAGPAADAGGQPAPPVVRRKLDGLREQEIVAALENNDWTIRRAALELGISRPSLYKLLEIYPHIRRAALFRADDDLRVGQKEEI